MDYLDFKCLNVQETCLWLKSIGISNVNRFLEEQIDGEVISLLTDEQLKELDVKKMGLRLRIMKRSKNKSEEGPKLLQSSQNYIELLTFLIQLYYYDVGRLLVSTITEFILGIYSTNILVSNCGTERCNGVYALNGLYDGCNLYKHSTEESIYIRTRKSGTWWAVSSFPHLTPDKQYTFYYTHHNPPISPDPVFGDWKKYNGTCEDFGPSKGKPPLPVLRREQWAKHSSDVKIIEPYGVVNSLKESAFRASSEFNGYCRACDGRLNLQNGRWAPKHNDRKSPWIEIHLGWKRSIVAVATQGNGASDIPEWVTTYEVQYNSNNGFRNAQSLEGNSETIFVGNKDPHTPVKHTFRELLFTDKIRFLPKTWNRAPALRVEVYVNDY